MKQFLFLELLKWFINVDKWTLLWNYLEQVFFIMKQFLFLELLKVYKCIANTNTTAFGQKKMNMEKVKEFVGDFNKFFEGLKAGIKDAKQIETWRDHFLRKYPEIFDVSSENEVEMDIEVATTMETESRPIIDREKKLMEVEEKLLSKKTAERLTVYDGVMSDPNLTLAVKIIHLLKAIDDVTRRKILWALLQGQLLEKCFCHSKKVYEETLVEKKITRQWAQFLRKLHKLVLKYNQLQFCTVSFTFLSL